MLIGAKSVPERATMDVQGYTSDYLAGTAALHAGRLTDAITAFKQVPQDSPCWVMAQGNLGLALLTMTRYQEAERQLQHVLAEIERRGCPYPPAHVQFMRNYAESLVQQHRWSESIEAFSRACEAADALAKEHSSLAAHIECAKAHALNSCGVAWLHLGAPAQAVAVLNQARDIFQRHSGDDRTGHAEALTNLALALAASGGDRTAAGFALKEAGDIAVDTGDHDQLFRILVVADKIGLDLYPAGRILELVEAGAGAALETERPGTAYLRYCQGASIAIQQARNADVGRRLARLARGLEPRLDPLDPHVPKLRYFEALLYRMTGENPARYTGSLVECAHHWYRRIAVPLVPADFRSRASDLHLHIRLLAGCLLEVGRHDEGVVAFDAGRALGYAVDVDPEYFSRVVARNPFARDGTTVDVTLLRQAQEQIGPDEAAVVLAVIPPRLVAFVVGRASVECVAVDAARTPAELRALDADAKMLPLRLAEGVGQRAIPRSLLAFGQGIVDQVGTRSVTGFIPYDSLHMVPWRAVLRECGLPWARLAFPVGFNFLLGMPPSRPVISPDQKVITLGHGTAGEVDLREEALEFARPFGDRGRTLPGCTAADVRRSLQSGEAVLLSCHGQATAGPAGARLLLELADGRALAEDVAPPSISSPLVILSACDSGVYHMAWGDYPLGAAPMLLRRGAGAVIGARFPVNARYAAAFFADIARRLAAGTPVETAFAHTLLEREESGADRWRDLACLELLRAT